MNSLYSISLSGKGPRFFDSGRPVLHRPIAETTHLRLMSGDNCFHLFWGQHIAPATDLALAEETSRLVRPLLKASLVLQFPQGLERRVLDRAAKPLLPDGQTQELNQPAKGFDRPLIHVLVAHDVKPGRGIGGPALDVAGPRAMDFISELAAAHLQFFDRRVGDGLVDTESVMV